MVVGHGFIADQEECLFILVGDSGEHAVVGVSIGLLVVLVNVPDSSKRETNGESWVGDVWGEDLLVATLGIIRRNIGHGHGAARLGHQALTLGKNTCELLRGGDLGRGWKVWGR